jgi:catechol 2,3-dioxygenase-like lactoylglutathione lyase family enzyme
MKKFDTIRLKRISHLAIGVRDLERQGEFCVNLCGLRPAFRFKQHLYLRAGGGHHYLFELIGDWKGLHHLSFQLEDDEDIERCAYILAKQSMRITLGREKGHSRYS